jgi:HlyD family secretion protein
MIKNALTAAIVVAAAGCASRDEPPPGYQGVVELDERLLSFEVPGRVVSVTAVRGQLVDPSMVLATLDDSQAQTAVSVREAEAKAAAERAKLVAAGGRTEDIRALEAQIRAAKANEAYAQKRAADDRTLVAKGAIASSALDESQTRLEAATSERQALEQRLRELRAGARREEVAGAAASATAAQSSVQLEKDRAGKYQLRAVQAGEVLDVHIDPGEVVGAGTPILTVGDTTHPYVDVFVPQADIGPVHVGAGASVRVDSVPQPLAGSVERVERRTEFTPRYLFNHERSNLVVRVRVRVQDPQRVLHAGVPAFVVIGP